MKLRPHRHRCAVPDCAASYACDGAPVAEGIGDRDAEGLAYHCEYDNDLHLCDLREDWVPTPAESEAA